MSGAAVAALSERNRLAMDRLVSFWKREMSDQILVQFRGAGIRRSNELQHEIQEQEQVIEGRPPTFEDVPKMLRDLESKLGPEPPPEEWVWDDAIGVPMTMPDIEFGHGIMGAILGAKLHTASSAVHTLTFNDPVVTDWAQVDGLRFDERNEWVQRVLGLLRYYVEHASRRFAIRLLLIVDGANFIVSMRGTTQAFYDLADRPPKLRDLYDVGYRFGARFFELRRSVVKEHNERIFQHRAFANTAPIHGVPWLDSDAYALCSPRAFEVGAEYKQRMLDHFGGGELYIHGLGRHIVPVAGRLRNLTQLSLYDDPNCTPYFEQRKAIRAETFDIPLMIDCTLEELVDGLAERTLPGGVKYNVFVPMGVSPGDLNELLGRVRQYRAGALAGRPK